MEAATSAITKPPQIPLPKVAQTARFMVRPLPFLERWRRRLGETFGARLLGPGEIYFISDPDSIKRLFAADRINTIAPGREFVLQPLLGTGSLLLQHDDEHLRRRKLMLPPFHGERMRAYEETIVEATERAVAGWPRGEEFALHPSMQSITLEVIVRAVFGIEDAGSPRASSAPGSSRSSTRRRRRPRSGSRSPPRARCRTTAASTGWSPATTPCSPRRSPSGAPTPALGEREDILSMLVAAEFDDGSKMSDGELRDQLMTLLLAGHETTATALAWTFDLLIHRPEALERLVAEVDAGEREYLDAVIEESLRVRPVVTFTGRELREPAALGGYEFEAGDVVMAGIYQAHTRADVYPEPFAFRPERFLDGETESFAWIPFGGGTRRCIGAAFALMEMRVAIAEILRRVSADGRIAGPREAGTPQHHLVAGARDARGHPGSLRALRPQGVAAACARWSPSLSLDPQVTARSPLGAAAISTPEKSRPPAIISMAPGEPLANRSWAWTMSAPLAIQLSMAPPSPSNATCGEPVGAQRLKQVTALNAEAAVRARV